MVDYILGADFNARHLLLALQTGERHRIAKAIAWEAIHTSVAGLGRRRRTVQLLGRARSLVRQLDSPYTDAMMALARGITAYLEGRWKPSHASLDRADRIFRSHCIGVIWELDTAHTFSLWSLLYMGRLAELSRRHEVLSREARARGDLYAFMNLGTYMMAVIRAASDEPAVARQELLEITARWSQRGFHIQHHNVLLARMMLDLYAGNGREAWDYISGRWSSYRTSFPTRQSRNQRG
jgi:hypothetical protein